MNEKPDPDSDEARLARHRDACRTVHPDVIQANRDAERQRLIDDGWTPPGEDAARPVGSIHRGNLKQQDDPWCREVLLYSPDNQGDSPEHRVTLYTAGRLSDALDWAEKGVREWRTSALSKGKQAEAARATARIAINHLQAILNQSRSHAEQQAADSAARDWLISIGSEPG